MDPTKRSRGLLGYFNFDQLNSIEGNFKDIVEPDPWPSTIDFLWSYLLTAVDEEWMSCGNKHSDPKKPALEDSAPVVTPPHTHTTQSALAEKLHHRDSFACLASPLTSLPGEEEDLGSFSILSISCLPQWSRSKWWSSFLRRVSHDISPGRVNAREVSLFTHRFSVFYPLAHPFPALDMLPDSLSLLSLVSILTPLATPLTGGARVPFHLVGDVVAF